MPEFSRGALLVASSVGRPGRLFRCNSSNRESAGSRAPFTTGSEARGEGTPPVERARAHTANAAAMDDLMREHGVIRRALVVYREAASRLRTRPSALPPDVLKKTAQLVRAFAEDYHERMLEEGRLFPAVNKTEGAAGALVNVLTAQHARGREFTDYLVASSGAAAVRDPHGLAGSLEEFARMYEEHAAIEDTIVLPAWKATMSARERSEQPEIFAEIEDRTFGEDGFADAVDRIAAIECELALGP